jgi:hypothetical protein
MTPADLSRVVCDDMEDRLRAAVTDLRFYCERHGEPLSDAQMFAVMSLPLRVLLGFDDAVASMVETFMAIRRVMPELPEWPTDEGLREWLSGAVTEPLQ